MFASRSFASAVYRTLCRGKHTLTELPYGYNGLEPVISREIMELHHGKHYAETVNKYNDLEEKLKQTVQDSDAIRLLNLHGTLRVIVGGLNNHMQFWESLSPEGGCPEGDLQAAITKDFGSVDAMKQQLSQLAIGIHGSGWAWLGFNKQRKLLLLATTKNEDALEPATGLLPILGIDVWEHAYYLQYKNARAEYVNKIWDVVNWKACAERYSKLNSSCN